MKNLSVVITVCIVILILAIALVILQRNRVEQYSGSATSNHQGTGQMRGGQMRGQGSTSRSCYGAKSGNCNTCEDVINAYKARGWRYNKRDFEQCRV